MSRHLFPAPMSLVSIASVACLFAACAGAPVDPASPAADAQASSAGVDGHSAAPDAGGANTGAGVDAGASQPDTQSAATETLVDYVGRLLSGTFDSSQQSATNPSYFAISLKMCRVHASGFGPRVLYVEQAMASKLNQPYRQRLYVLSDPSANGKVVSEVWAPTNPGKWVGTCDKPGVQKVPDNAFTLRAGCAVHLAIDGGKLVGGTVGQDCSSTLSGAKYATAKVTVDEGKLTSWDQGFNAAGSQVWGATAGPYIFARKTPLMTEKQWQAMTH